MKVSDLVWQLRQQGVKLKLDGEQLHVSLPEGGIDNALKASLIAQKEVVKEYIRSLSNHRPALSDYEISASGKTEAPLSFAQKRLWFIEQLGDSAGQYHIPVPLAVFGRFNEAVAEQAFSAVIHRHPALRTRIVTTDEVQVQQVTQDQEFTLARFDLTDVTDTERQARLKALLSEQAVAPFDLSQGLMMRGAFIRLAPDCGDTSVQVGVLMIVIHHIAFDGWSSALLAGDFTTLYQRFLQGQRNPLKPLPISYIDYSLWQQRWFDGPKMPEQLQYWQKQLADMPQLHSLPLDFARPKRRAGIGGLVLSKLRGEVVSSLGTLAKKLHLTPFILLHGALALLLSKHSNNKDIVIGTPVANRATTELEALVGFFVNTLVLRVDTNKADFGDYFAHVRQVNHDALANQDLPFDYLVEQLDVVRSQAVTPLFQVMFAMNNNDLDSLEIPEARFSALTNAAVAAKFDLSVIARMDEQRLDFSWTYDAEIFKQERIEGLSDDLCRLLERLVQTPDAPLASLSVMDQARIAELTDTLKGNIAPLDETDTLPLRFERQVAKAPKRCALVLGDEYIDYQQLNQNANRVAHYLLGQNLPANSIIGVCGEKSPATVATLLGVMKSGLAFVMFDPMYPTARLQHMAKDADIACLLYTDGRAAALGLLQGQLAVDYFSPSVREQSTENPTVQQGAELAYLAYTSGSTGLPKGVRSRKIGVLNYLDYLNDNFAMTADDTCLQLASLAFDASVRDTFAPLTQGACVVLADKSSARDPEALRGLIERHQVTVIPAIVPSVLTELVMCDAPAATSLRLILTSGEPLTMALCHQTRVVFGEQVQLVNQYGPTETTMTACFHRVDFDRDSHSMVPVGKAIQNLSLYLLDDEQQIVPQGCIAELYIGGVGLAEGYHHLAEQSEKVFIDNPFGPGKLYRSGDRLSLDGDGVLHFVGRVDNQVKLRGLRIELGEIESALTAIAGIELAAAGVSANQTLVAWYQGRQLEQGALKAILGNTLADHMVPQLFIHLDKLPLSANGKIDREQLPQPSEVELYGQYQAPQGRFEQQLASIWAELLTVDVQKIGRDSDFFALGGHSLLAVRLSSQIRKQFNCELPVAAVFSHGGLAQLAQQIESSTQALMRPAIIAQDKAQQQLLLCSFAQQRLWFIDQLQDQSRQYNMPIAFEVKGALDIDKAEQALNLIVTRHSVLRTVYITVDGEPKQQVLANAAFHFDVQDVAALDEAEVLALIDRDSKLDFDLASDLMIRGSYFKGADRSWLLVNMHHIASDAWSMMVLLREFRQAYSALIEGKTPQLEPLALQYSDYALWQRQWLKGEVLQTQLDYWQQQLAQAPVVHDLPLKGARDERKRHLGEALLCHAPAGLAQALNHFAISRQLTPFMAIHSAFALVLSRHSNSKDIVIGTPVANRLQAELEPLIGFFVNTLVLRASTDFVRLDEYLAHIKALNLAAQSHQDIPFEQLVEHTQVPRSNAHTPLFQIMLTLNNVQSGGPLQLPGTQFKALAPKSRVVKYDIELIVRFDEGQLQWEWLYDVALFERDYIDMLNQHLLMLLSAMVKGQQVRLAQLPLLSEAQIDHQLFTLNQTMVAMPAQSLLHQLFEQQALQTPQNCALVFEQQQLSFSELNCRANQLAVKLRELGAGPEILIALELPRSIEMIVAMLAVLKSGSAYVPVDPELPLERRRFILNDTQAKVLLVGPQHQSYGEDMPLRVVPVDLSQQGLAQYSWWQNADSNLPLVAGQNWQSAAYVIYTSGSTGQPKGVVNEHRGVVNRLLWGQKTFNLTPEDKVMQKTPYAFDVSVWECFWPLSYGATLVLAKPDGHKEPQYLSQLMHQQQVTVMHFVPSMLAAYRYSENRLSPSIKMVFCSGEALNAAEVNWVKQQLPQAKMHNLYGPTEAAIEVSHFDCSELSYTSAVPIGKPIDNVRLLVLDDDLNLCPYGSAGQLHIGGVAVAREYLNQAALSAEQFIDNPFASRLKDEPFADKLYRTGDLVRLLPDGNIAYLGRVDRQVKLRGLRIELAEIEAQLLALPSVDNCVVAVREDSPGDQRLVAYVVSKDGFGCDVASAELARHLPQYMVPSVYVELEALPLNPNGKVDHKALPKPQQAGVEQTPSRALSQDEQKLADIWAQLLGIDVAAITPERDFFSLGGHSLLAVRLVANIRKTCGRELAVSDIFGASTLAAMTAKIELNQSAQLRPTITVQPRGSEPVACAYAQQRLWFIDQLQGQSREYNMPLTLKVSGEFDVAVAEQALNHIIARHEILRTVYVTVDGEPKQQILGHWRFVFEQHDISALNEAEQQKLIAEHRIRAFDLSQDLMLRASYLKAQQGGYVLFNMHHIASDAWSIAVLVKEFVECYRAFKVQDTPALAPLPLQYADFALWQRQWLQGEVLQTQLDYWREQLSGISAVHSLPLKGNRPAVKQHAGAQYICVVDSALCGELERFAQAQRITPFMVLHGVLAQLLARHGNTDDVVIGTPVANRLQTELEPLIGFFVNTLVLRTRVDFDRVDEYFAHIREVNLAAQNHQDIPFEQLVEHCQVPRNTAHTPLFQIMLTLNNVDNGKGLDLPGSQFSALDFNQRVVKYDLELVARFEGGKLQLSWLYDVALFDQQYIVVLAEHFERLLQGIISASAPSPKAIEMLSDKERSRIFALNQTAKPLTQNVLIHHGFERFAQHSPNHCAVVFADKQLSYGELDSLANQLANYLVSQGCKAESLVAIEMERSLEMVIAILAILKAGGAYVPLDPQLPVERRKFILADTKAELVLCTTASDKELAGDATYVLVDLNAAEPWQQCAVQAPTVETINWHNAAYVIYTSGSTGQPKGVVNEHRALVNRIQWMQDAYGLNADDKVMQKTPYGFDVSVWEFLWTLGYGATLVVAKPQGHKDPQYLSELMAKHQVSVMHFVPSMLVAYRHSGCAIAPSLRLLLCSGEALGASEVHWLTQKAPWVSLHNLYGPTEAAIDVSHFACAELGERAQVPIGKPIDNIQLLVLDNKLNLCPVGVAGELHIGGIGLARGYLNRPELTDKQFIANPFAEHFAPSCQSAKLYKTGDLVRLCDDEHLAYLGRIDRQVKLRGLRIELGEIEAQLSLVTGIDNCAVMVREDVPGEQLLVAYVVATNFDQASVMAALANVLPQYMVPAVYVELGALPLSVNGKVDVKALPAPKVQRVDVKDHQALSVAALQLANIWSQLLGIEVEAIGENSDFFALGGHSLLAVRLVARVHEQLNMHCDLALVFANSRLGDMSRALTQPLEQSVGIQVIKSTAEQWLPTSYAQQQLWFIDTMQGDSAEYHMPSVLAIEGELDMTGAQQAVRAIIDAHQVLRSRYRLKDQQVQQQILADFDFTISEFDLQSLDETTKTQRLAQIVHEQRVSRFSLDGDVAIRVALVKLAPMRQQLLFNMHHIASDGWSINLVVEAFAKLYGQWIAGERNLTLAPPKVQYADYARWQREQLTGEALEQHLQYWCEYLKDVSPLHGIRTDKPRPARQSRLGEQLEQSMSGELYQKLKAYCAEHQMTLFMLLQSVYAAVLWRVGESDDILFGTPQAGRQSAQCEEVVGNFVNTTVIRRQFDQKVTFNTLLATAKADLLNSYPHQVMPFDLLIEKLNPERRLDYNPLIQLWFVMQNQPADELRLTGLKLAGIKQDKVNAQFDIQLSAFEANGQLYLKWTWASDLFERATLLHISECFESMLKAALAEPDRPLAQLAIPSKADILSRQQQQTKSKVRSKRFVRKAPGTAKGAI